jgi:hypothetical protein
MDVPELLREPRHVSAGYHLLAGQAWRRQGESLKQHAPVVYAALEYRCAIERAVLELYLLVAPGAADAPDKLRDFGSLVAQVHQNAGNKRKLWRVLSFNETYARAVMSLPLTMAVPDIGSLHNTWQRLSDYCHRQLDPKETWNSGTWVTAAYSFLAAAEEDLWELIMVQRRGWLHVDTMPPEMRAERSRFVEGSDDVATLERRLRLIMPVVQARLALERGGV